MTLRAAAEQALDTLEHVQAHIGRYDPPVVTTIARAMQPTIDALRSALAAEQPQPEAPSGWRMVPVEPTAKMLAAGVAAESNASTHVQERLTLLAYRAMLAAAPTPPTGGPR